MKIAKRKSLMQSGVVGVNGHAGNVDDDVDVTAVGIEVKQEVKVEQQRL